MSVKQLSLFIENKPGTINAACKLLSDNGISISTLSLADTKFFGILRMLIENWEQAKELLEKSGFAVKVTDVVAIEVDHKPGSLSSVLAVLDKNSINVEYMYAFAAGYHNKAVLIFRFDDPEVAVEKIKSALNIVEPKDLFKA